MAHPLYLTTPLYYVNDTPHIGHAYTTLAADILCRYHRLWGTEVYFLTGIDEHGQKVEKAAKAQGKDPQAHCDDMSLNFVNIWNELNIAYDVFYRTSDPAHHRVVQEALSQLHARELIYKQSYEGWYAESEEIFYAEKDLVDGKSPSGSEVKKVSETNYFFKMSAFQARLIAHIEAHPDYIQPKSKKNEVLGFLKRPLQDLCISRPKARLAWGIEIPFDRDYVTYVWFDALLNYAAAVGLFDTQREDTLAKWWPHAVHLIGKDILTTHAVYWSTMLMALEQPLPKTIFAHGWWLTSDNEKMSKSKGSVVKPLDMKDTVGVEGLRYFLTRDIRFGSDAQFSAELVINRVNTDLANNLGNLLNRSTGLVEKYFAGACPAFLATSLEMDDQLNQAVRTLPARVKKHIEQLEPSEAAEIIFETLSICNQYVDHHAPWTLAKENLPAAGHVLRQVLECLLICGHLLQPILPQKMAALLARLGQMEPIAFDLLAASYPHLKEGQRIEKGDALFPRLEAAS